MEKRSHKHWLVSNIIGRMNISRMKNHDLKIIISREFVVYGAEPTPFHGLDVHSLNSELAAIIVKVTE